MPESQRRRYHTGVDRGMVYPHAMEHGVPWTGLISVSESNEDVRTDPIYVDGYVVAHDVSPGRKRVAIEAYDYPDEFAEHCLGESMIFGLATIVHNQPRGRFNLAYRRRVGDQTGSKDHYKIVLISNAYAVDSEATYDTIGDTEEPSVFSWELDTAVDLDAFNHLMLESNPVLPTSMIVIDTRKVAPDLVAEIEALLYHPENPQFVTIHDIRNLVAGYNPEQIKNLVLNPRGQRTSGTRIHALNYLQATRQSPISTYVGLQMQMVTNWSETEPYGWRRSYSTVPNDDRYVLYRYLGNGRVEFLPNATHGDYQWDLNAPGGWETSRTIRNPIYKFTTSGGPFWVTSEHDDPYDIIDSQINVPAEVMGELDHYPLDLTTVWANPNNGRVYLSNAGPAPWTIVSTPELLQLADEYMNFEVVSPSSDLEMVGADLVGPDPVGWNGDRIYWSESMDAVHIPRNVSATFPLSGASASGTLVVYDVERDHTTYYHQHSGNTLPTVRLEARYVRVAYIDGLYDGEYFDGDSDRHTAGFFHYDYEWVGQAHNSVSNRNPSIL